MACLQRSIPKSQKSFTTSLESVKKKDKIPRTHKNGQLLQLHSINRPVLPILLLHRRPEIHHHLARRRHRGPCWGPKTHNPTKPTLLLIHGIGANAMWQWNDFVSPLSSKFNVYVPDLLFFGDSYTTRPERTEAFQAQSVMRAMEAMGVRTNLRVVGLSYGGFVAYSMAAQFPDAVERVVLGCAGVCLEERDMEEGLFRAKSVDEAIDMLLAQSPEKLRDLMKLSFYKPPVKNVPSCFLSDFIDVMCRENLQERKELIHALHKDRKLSDLPKITQPTLIIWGEHDQVFPLELAHRLLRHLENNAQLVVLKNAGHAINLEKTKELYTYLKSFLNVPLSTKIDNNNGNSCCKVD